ncbi:hypothetical protein NE237_032542 [Protea cynaroides]|uniref:MaoC-like domain-containing protein n=1 Tax=Protea cynaroides TaxID=273540 RepID=A0A9Q0R3N1_9MAGN|nr:hypothetical protein NE237_032542 [Protea cynaroides]
MVPNKLAVTGNNGFIVTREHIRDEKLTNLEIIIVDLEDNQVENLNSIGEMFLTSGIDLIVPRGSVVAGRPSPLDSQPLLLSIPFQVWAGFALFFVLEIPTTTCKPAILVKTLVLGLWFSYMAGPLLRWLLVIISIERKRNEMQSQLRRWCRRRWKITDLKPFSDADVLEYSKLSHDFNLLHFDSEIARDAGLEDRLVPGRRFSRNTK